MKKFFWLLILCFLCPYGLWAQQGAYPDAVKLANSTDSVPVFYPITYGLMAGGSVSRSSGAELKDLGNNIQWQGGISAGIVATYRANPERKIFTQTEILFSTRGYQYDFVRKDFMPAYVSDSIDYSKGIMTSAIKGAQTLFYIDMPLMVGYDLSPKFALMGGLMTSLRIFSLSTYRIRSSISRDSIILNETGEVIRGYNLKLPDENVRDYANDAIDLLDLAFAVGAKYRFNDKLALNLRFTRDIIGLSIASKDFINDRNINTAFNISLSYRLLDIDDSYFPFFKF